MASKITHMAGAIRRNLGIHYKETILTRGESFAVEKYWHPTVDPWSPIYKDMLEPFNLWKNTVPRLPVNLGKFDIAMARKCPNVLRVPIKKAGSVEICLPAELVCLRDEIKRILQYDYWVTGDVWRDMWCHLTIDTTIVEPGTTHRFPGFHGDGLQGGKFTQKIMCEHSYIVTDPYQTIIAMQPFFVAHLNDSRDNVFSAFDEQIQSGAKMYRLRKGELYLIDPYVVHASPINHKNKRFERTFVRLTTTPQELLMPKNTVNPMFDTGDYPSRIEIREFVSKPDRKIPHGFYGIEKLV